MTHQNMNRQMRPFCRTFGLLLVLAIGCNSSDQPELVVYTALDWEFSEPIFREFRAKTGIRVRPKYDSEASKTVGLVNLILNERDRPRCDLFWNNEILNTLRLEKDGLLADYASPMAGSYPQAYRSPRGTWYGFAARARVLLVNTGSVSDEDEPNSIEDLLDPRWKDRVGFAKPLFGTTATHAACLFEAWGDDRAMEFFQKLKDNARVFPGNRQVAQAVSGGQLEFGLTDTDDAIVEIEKGMPVRIIYPDQMDEQLGTLFIPNTLALLANSPNPEPARQLVDFLLSPEIEKRLAEGRSAQIPLNPNVEAELRVATPEDVRAMKIDFGKAAEKWEVAASFLRDLFSADRP